MDNSEKFNGNNEKIMELMEICKKIMEFTKISWKHLKLPNTEATIAKKNVSCFFYPHLCNVHDHAASRLVKTP